eukprot:CAMPEP_0114122770 /NCGR_PEP_ID=MMETSP0043_2-20121206/7871_1 /TAXON_ID=464988 /ORGANISM="Hemiselmis andersenii, Strain CCMP644" /LENGTH=53 /DNA_ID=CAMNT_0001215505 /DNA_START=181 /DNA_END=339 /DNA_ORIENTATION=-
MSGSAGAHHRSSSTFVDEYVGVAALYQEQNSAVQGGFLRRNLSFQRAQYEADL